MGLRSKPGLTEDPQQVAAQDRWRGTEYEGCNIPGLYHRYAGHDNNRDAIGQNVIESYYMGQLLFHQWMPQTYMDHHHINPDGARMYIAPYINPIRPYTDPITWRELSWYGASMAYKMEADGLPGISSGAKFPALSAYSFCDLCNGHNITGMLSESALAKGASPRYVDPSQLVGDHDRVQPNYEAQTNFPNPWPGGWWRLGDIVRQMYLAAYYLLETMASNREMILRNTALKALNQTERGKNSPEFAFIIPEKQHDTGEVHHLIRLLRLQNIEVHRAVEPFEVGCVCYPAGTYVVFMAQPRMGVAMNLLRRSFFPDNQWTRDASGGRKAFDTATDNIAEYMNVKAIPAGQPFEGKFELVEGEGSWPIPVLRGSRYIIAAAENSAYKTVNLLLREKFRVFRVDDSRDHDFYVEGAKKIQSFVENGGRLIAINKSCNFAVDYLNLGVRNVVARVPVREFTTHGSTLRVNVDTDHPACYGMEKEALVLNWDSPAFVVCDGFKAELYQMPVKYPDSDLLRSGLLEGEKYIAGKGAVAICRKGKGDVVLYGCWPQFRAQTTGAFKLFFNMLYR